MTKLSLFSLVLITGVGAAAVACGSSSDDSAATAGSSGAAGHAGSSTGGTTSGGSGGATGGSATGGSATGGSATGGTATGGTGGSAGVGGLYTRLGMHDGIATEIGKIVGAELGDSDIASFFAPNLKDPKHMPQAGDIEECFTSLLGNAAGGPETYPMTTASGFTCRSMKAAHVSLHIGTTTFDNFVAIAGAQLKTDMVSDADISTIAGVLTGQKMNIADTAAPPTGPCTAPACDVGSAGAAGAQ